MDELLTYHGVDWVGMALSLLGVYLLGNKNKWGFIVFMLGNAVFVFLGLTWMDSIGVAVGNVVFLVINFRGYLSWNKQLEETAEVA